MSNFDIALGFGQEAINQVATIFFQKGKDTIFKGQIAASGFTINWQANTAPVVNLTPPSLRLAKKIVESCDISGKYPRLVSQIEKDPSVKDAVADIIANSDNTFTLIIEQFQLSFPGNDIAIPLIARCSITSTGSSVKINLLSISITVDGSVNQEIVNKFVVPKMTDVITSMLNGITIPVLSIPGAQLGATAVAIQNTQVIVFANLSSNPSIPSVSGFTFPSSNFFAALGPNVLHAEVYNTINGKTYGPSGSIDLGITHADYHATVTVQNPQTSLNGTQLVVDLSLSGSAGASIQIGCSHPSIDFNVSAVPNPTVACSLSLNGNNLSISGSGCSSFVSIVTVSGWVPPIVSQFVDAITSAIATLVTATVSSNIVSAISFASFTVPTIPINYGGVSIVVSGSGLSINNCSGYLAIEGNVTVA